MTPTKPVKKAAPKVAPKVAHLAPAKAAPSGRYHEGIGRRKTAVARARLFAGSGKITVNGMTLAEYFQMPRFRVLAESPIGKLNFEKKFDVSVHVSGGGIKAQAEAVRHGIARALVLQNGDSKKQLRSFGYLTRDSRMVERKKYGLKKARRAPQWAKR